MKKKEILKYQKEVKKIDDKIKKSFGVFKKENEYVARCGSEEFAQTLLNNLLLEITQVFNEKTQIPFKTKEIKDVFISFLEMSQISHNFILKIQQYIVKGLEDKNELLLTMKMNDRLFKAEGFLLFSFYNTIECYLRLINTSQVNYNRLSYVKEQLQLGDSAFLKIKKKMLKEWKLDPNLSDKEFEKIIDETFIQNKSTKESDLEMNFYS